MENSKICEIVKDLVKAKLSITVGMDDMLFGVAGGFDSLGLLSFILELESKFDVIVADDDLTPENFSTIARISAYIQSLLES